MTSYPSAIDTDSDIPRVDNNISEIADIVVNSLRDAVFSLEATLGINPQGSAGTVVSRLDKSLNPDGTIRSSALTSVGLATLPITNSQVASNAGIKETKLALDFSTSSLHTQLLANQGTLTSLATFTTSLNSNLLAHIHGNTTLIDGISLARHVASHIDINAVPSDTRDVLFTWAGLKDKTGAVRSAKHVASALLQINDDLVNHENATTNAHPATAITVDTNNFSEIPADADTVQKALDALDDTDRLVIGDHRATQHSNGIPKHARSQQLTLDGYSQNIVQATKVQAFLVNPPSTTPVDSNTQGDDLIKFIPDNTGFVFDSQFAQVKDGDIITINYGNGIQTSFEVESIRFIAGSDWFVRINGTNLHNTDGYDAFARIDRPAYDDNTHGVLAVAAANNNINSSIMGSVVVGHPRGATALGLGFDPDELNSTHYNLYLNFYPTGNPLDKTIQLPAIDVTGNLGTTPGQYTINSVVAVTNDAFRAAGYNYRFVAFSKNGEFGVMLADPIGNASFSIVNGVISGSTIIAGSYTNNVIGDATDEFDALGLGVLKADIASPEFVPSFSSSSAAASFPTKVIPPLRRRNAVVNGTRRDTFADTYLANADGYWAANLTSRVPVGVITIETTYEVLLDLSAAGLAPGKTIVVQPAVAFSDGYYNDADYGRFIIKNVAFTPACGSDPAKTSITVINGVHAAGNPIGFSSSPILPVRLYFSEDSVGFNAVNVIDPAPTATIYNRFHEIFITESGNTFSHERARMPKQSEGAAFSLLATNNRWTIQNVSPKLRGFRDDGYSNLNKYIRFYVLDYDSSTGVYDGYIGKRSGSGGITRTGNITKARKNVPARFYDETNVDYIELEFYDETASAGANIMSTNQPRYVDIELFSSLQLDEENMIIGTCELDNLTVKAVKDRRAFGSISEKDFTQSAIDFITAGDRYLHENGVIRGMSFVSVGTDPHLLKFNGGLVLVNGHVVAVNNAEVSIPEIRKFGDTLPATVHWAICVNETGQYEPIVLTTTKQQYFVTTGAGSYYVPSVTLNELITERKDLVLIYIATATINSITLTVSDARRYVTNVGFNSEFVLTSDDEQVPGAFKSVEAVISWIKNSSSANHVVKVRGGDIALSATAMSDFGGKKVTFDGFDFARGSGTATTFSFSGGTAIFGTNITLRYVDIKLNDIGALFGDSNTFDHVNLVGGINFNIILGNLNKFENVFMTGTSGNFVFGNNFTATSSIIYYTGTATNPTLGTGTKFDQCVIQFANTTGMLISGNSKVLGSSLNFGDAQKMIEINGNDYVFQDTTFTYNPIGLTYFPLTTNSINGNLSVAAIYSGSLVSDNNRDGVRVENCTFTNTLSGVQRPPYIQLAINRGETLNNIVVRNNKFNDPANLWNQCCVAILNTNVGSGNPVISNSIIENNIVNREQSFVLATTIITNFPDINEPGLIANNVFIRKNKCGNIGFLTAAINTTTDMATTNADSGLTIEDNTCRYIANLDDSGNFKFSAGAIGVGKINHGTGHVTIRNNICHWIHTACIATSIFISGKLHIDGNKLQAHDTTYLTSFGAEILGSPLSPLNFAIYIPTGASPYDDFGFGNCRITNNSIDYGISGATPYDYLSCLFTDTGSIITGNVFAGIKNDSVNSTMCVANGLHSIISDNLFYRYGSSVSAYVRVSRTDGYGLIVDNVFDSPSINGTNEGVVDTSATNHFIVERNINQTVTQYFNASNGTFVVSDGTSLMLYGTLFSGVSVQVKNPGVPPYENIGHIKFNYAGGSGTRILKWLIPLEDTLPKGVTITEAGFTGEADAVASSSGQLNLAVANDSTFLFSGSHVGFSGIYVPNTPVTLSRKYKADPSDQLAKTGQNICLDIGVGVSSASNINSILYSAYVKYRWC